MTTNILYDKDDGVIYDQGMRYAIGDINTYVYDSLDNLRFIYGTLHEGMVATVDIGEEIQDFSPRRYLYVDGQVLANPDWTPPQEV